MRKIANIDGTGVARDTKQKDKATKNNPASHEAWMIGKKQDRPRQQWVWTQEPDAELNIPGIGYWRKL